jgi:hypothetical protein
MTRALVFAPSIDYTHAMTDLPLPPRKFVLPKLLMTLFLRAVALACLWYGLHFWGDLIGYTAHGAKRFDLLATDLATANATLAVLYPVAAVGLWLRGAWGPVIWSAASALEIVMHQVFIDTFGSDPIKMAAIAVVALVYLALRLWIVLGRRASRAAQYG